MSFGYQILGFGSFPNRTTAFIPSTSVWSDGSNDYLNKTDYSSGGSSSKVMTVGGWFKLCEVSISGSSALTMSPTAFFAWTRDNNSNDYVRISLYDGTGQIRLVLQNTSDATRLDWYTTQRFRDPSAWFHVVWTVSTDGEAVNKLWVNGAEVTSFTKTTDSLADGDVFRFGNSSHHHSIFADPNGSANNETIYASQMFYQDGQKVSDITNYGKYNSKGIWVPIDISGLTFGTNGYLLSFSDSSAFGADSSGNGNNFTVNGSMAAAQQVEDGPANDAANDIGNYATFNSINKTYNWVLSVGNTKAVNGGAGNDIVGLTIPFPRTGVYGVKLTNNTTGTDTGLRAGIANAKVQVDDPIWNLAGRHAILYEDDGKVFINGTEDTSGKEDWGSSGDILEIIYDAGEEDVEFWVNGVSQGSYDFVAGTLDEDMFVYVDCGATFDIDLDAGQSGYDPSTRVAGAKRLNTANLPQVTIDPQAYFQTCLYAGAAANGTLTVTGCADASDTNWTPDLVWIKCRNNGNSNLLHDSLRGTDAALRSDSPAAESQYGSATVTMADGGFVISPKGETGISANTHNHVAWCWKAGGAPTATNTAGAGNTPTAGSVKIDGANLGSALAGTIPATKLSANTTSGFSIVTYTGSGSTGTIAHGLGVAPKLVIVKRRSADASGGASDNWTVYHIGADATAPETKYLVLNDDETSQDDTIWNDDKPDATTFNVYSNYSKVNASTGREAGSGDGSDPHIYVAYCFAEIEGYSEFGYYIGNTTNRPFVYLGFKPALIMVKKVDGTDNNWSMLDNKRHPFNDGDAPYIYADRTQVETNPGDGSQDIDFLANGFKVRNSNNAYNTNNNNYAFAAWAETPFASNNRAS